MSRATCRCTISLLFALAFVYSARAADPLSDLPANTWVKLTPVEGSAVSPRMGYEGDCRWDAKRQLMIRYGGHNQGGGGEQGSEVWLFDPRTAKWELRHPNFQPPGVCCAQQNVFDPAGDRYIRFPAFSHSHGWQWKREIDLNNWSVWTYDVGGNTWRNMRPVPSPQVSPLRCASWDSDHQVIVLFGGEGNSEGTLVYDPYTNTWTRMKPTGGQPRFRSGGSMAYDAARKLHILFGIQFEEDPHTWAYDLVKNEWRDLKPATMPPTKENDAVLSYDPVSSLIIALVKQTEKRKRENRKEGEDEFEEIHSVVTWGFDAGKNEWKKMEPKVEPTASGNRTRQLMWASGLNVTLLENCTGRPREQQVWVYRAGEGAKAKEDRGPAAPKDLLFGVAKDGVAIAATPGDGARHIAIYGGDAPSGEPWKTEMKLLAKVEAEGRLWVDKNTVDTSKRQVRWYQIRSVAADGTEGAPTARLTVQPSVIEDIFVSVASEKKTSVRWSPSRALKAAKQQAELERIDPWDDRFNSWSRYPSEVGYIVERAPVEVISTDQSLRIKSRTPELATPMVAGVRKIGAFTRLTKEPVKALEFTDETIDLSKPGETVANPLYERKPYKDEFNEAGKPYPRAVFAYRVRAVNALGVESGPSPATFTIPSPVQQLFSKEEAGTCHLKWAANPEQGIAGYRVYRLDGRYDKQPVSRLTNDPIKELAFSDATAGKSSRRYHVIAVDALGQEGFPSSPVWHEREWKDFYKPFVGEWHQ